MVSITMGEGYSKIHFTTKKTEIQWDKNHLAKVPKTVTVVGFQQSLCLYNPLCPPCYTKVFLLLFHCFLCHLKLVKGHFSHLVCTGRDGVHCSESHCSFFLLLILSLEHLPLNCLWQNKGGSSQIVLQWLVKAGAYDLYINGGHVNEPSEAPKLPHRIGWNLCCNHTVYELGL